MKIGKWKAFVPLSSVLFPSSRLFFFFLRFGSFEIKVRNTHPVANRTPDERAISREDPTGVEGEHDEVGAGDRRRPQAYDTRIDMEKRGGVKNEANGTDWTGPFGPFGFASPTIMMA